MSHSLKPYSIMGLSGEKPMVSWLEWKSVLCSKFGEYCSNVVRQMHKGYHYNLQLLAVLLFIDSKAWQKCRTVLDTITLNILMCTLIGCHVLSDVVTSNLG